MPTLNRQPTTGNVAPLLLKPAEAAQALSISERTLFTLTKNGTIPAVRLGRSVRYDVEALRTFVVDQQSRPNNSTGTNDDRE
ncbi:MAG: helix-turn-helix domain-containing protein [Planctomycetaceae bacterium]|nr:helix-turn-helix domain-containing protein [Planctomycetaceae bacterium]